MFGLCRPFLAVVLCVACWALPAAAEERPLVHVVYKGQRLGSIAKRYNVSIEALCKRNGIKRRDPIQPGQRLVIPGRAAKVEAKDERSKSEREKKQRRIPRASELKPRKHKVYKGQTLGALSKRYHVGIAAICHANRISRSDPIKPGQVLLIPSKADSDGRYARTVHDKRRKKRARRSRGSSQRPSWAKYEKLPWRRGYVRLVGYNDQYKGYVIGPKNRVLPLARQKISKLLAATGERPRIHRRLIELIAKVSDTFGGRQLRIVSGYRERSYAAASRHKTGRAVDFSIPGVPNAVLKDYLCSLGGVGVGYYPNSSFVHLDVRKESAYWVDHSGPGQPPRYRRRDSPSDRTASTERPKERKRE